MKKIMNAVNLTCYLKQSAVLHYSFYSLAINTYIFELTLNFTMMKLDLNIILPSILYCEYVTDFHLEGTFDVVGRLAQENVTYNNATHKN